MPFLQWPSWFQNRPPVRIAFAPGRRTSHEIDLLQQLVDAAASGDADQFKSIANMFEELNTDGLGSILLTRALYYNWDPAIIKILVEFPPEFFDWTIGT